LVGVLTSLFSTNTAISQNYLHCMVASLINLQFAVLFRSGKSTGFRRTPPRLSSPYKTTEYNAKLTNRLLFSFLSDYIIVVCCRISPACPADLPMSLDLNGALPSQTPWREPPPPLTCASVMFNVFAANKTEPGCY